MEEVCGSKVLGEPFFSQVSIYVPKVPDTARALGRIVEEATNCLVNVFEAHNTPDGPERPPHGETTQPGLICYLFANEGARRSVEQSDQRSSGRHGADTVRCIPAKDRDLDS